MKQTFQIYVPPEQVEAAMRQRREKLDELERVKAKARRLIDEVIKKHPNILLPDDEGLYMALHDLKQEIQSSEK